MRPSVVGLVLLIPLAGALAGVGTSAAGGLWGADKKLSPRDQAIRQGDNAVRRARQNVGSGGQYGQQMLATADSEQHARKAVAAYEKAISLGSGGVADAEVYYRALQAVSFYRETQLRWELVIKYFDLLRAADPRDPRETLLIVELCTALSKLGGMGGPDSDVYYARGVTEYQTWRSRIDETDTRMAIGVSIQTTNAAELLMALGPGRIDEAVTYYTESVDLNPGEALGWYGLAVAADRDGQWGVAVKAMKEAIDRDWSKQSGQRMARLFDQGVYFVPDGDVFYYVGLRSQIEGKHAEAIAAYRTFLAECGDTKYAHRAREHLAELEKKQQRPQKGK